MNVTVKIKKPVVDNVAEIIEFLDQPRLTIGCEGAEVHIQLSKETIDNNDMSLLLKDLLRCTMKLKKKSENYKSYKAQMKAIEMPKDEEVDI